MITRRPWPTSRFKYLIHRTIDQQIPTYHFLNIKSLRLDPIKNQEKSYCKKKNIKIQSVAENLIRTNHLLEWLLGSMSETLRLCLIIGLDYKTLWKWGRQVFYVMIRLQRMVWVTIPLRSGDKSKFWSDAHLPLSAAGSVLSFQGFPSLVPFSSKIPTEGSEQWGIWPIVTILVQLIACYHDRH